MIKNSVSTMQHIMEFRKEVAKFQAGETLEAVFRGIGAVNGIYELRQSGNYLVRVRGTAGVFEAHQAIRIAEISRLHGNGVVHVTTRQDMQIHGVRIEDTPMILELLHDAELSSIGTGGNTVRNVSACPNAGICEREAFDVTPYALALADFFMNESVSFNLPRKFKVAFSGCGRDCGLASVADLGFFAHELDGVQGFAVYAGGGMGAHSAVALQIEEFIPTESVCEVAEAVKRIFEKHGDRTNRSKARLRFVLERVGKEEFIRMYREELALLRREPLKYPSVDIGNPSDSIASASDDEDHKDVSYAEWKVAYVTAQKQCGLFAVRVPLLMGDIASVKLAALSEAADKFSDGTIRAMQGQDLQLRNIRKSELLMVYRELANIDSEYVASVGIKCVACVGASTCRIGLCDSRKLALTIQTELADVKIASPVYISGCTNACGHHPVAAIGMYGCLRRVNEKMVPHFTLVAGGQLGEGCARLAETIATVPAEEAPGFLRSFLEEASGCPRKLRRSRTSTT